MKKLVIVLTILLVVSLGVIALLLLNNSSSGYIPDTSRNTTVLDLRGQGLTALQSQIGEYTELIEFLVDDNSLTGALPAEINKMRDLEVLSASNNLLTGIPAEIGQLKNLRIIDFSNNDITTFPNELFNLTQPFELRLEGNPLSVEQIGELRANLPNATIIF